VTRSQETCELYLVGYFDTDGNYDTYRTPIYGFERGDRFQDPDGMTWAVRDQYGDWVSPLMLSRGIKVRQKIVEVSP
jgi:hypothetical protein